MIKFLTVLAIAVAVYFAGKGIYSVWQDVSSTELKPKFVDEYTTTIDGDGTQDSNTSAPAQNSTQTTEPVSPARAGTSTLSGMPANLEASYQQAKAGGIASLKAWIFENRSRVQDPRLAEIQLDYVLAVTSDDLLEAKRTFAQVQRRIGPDSPLYPRVQSMSASYE